MKVIAFVGPSGTGKSYRSIMVSQKHGADAIIDDGLLISHGKVIAGTSAKKEATRIGSVKHALFMNSRQAAQITQALKRENIKCLMILGTSEGMVQKIARNLGVGEVGEIVHIEDVASKEEMSSALRMRKFEGKHVIPVPTFEIKQDFSGYFLHPLRRLRRSSSDEPDTAGDKSIVRPTFSYLGDFTISDNVINSIALHEARKVGGVTQIYSVNLRKTTHGVHIDMAVAIGYGFNIAAVSGSVQRAVRDNIEKYTSINARKVNITVRGLSVADDSRKN